MDIRKRTKETWAKVCDVIWGRKWNSGSDSDSSGLSAQMLNDHYATILTDRSYTSLRPKLTAVDQSLCISESTVFHLLDHLRHCYRAWCNTSVFPASGGCSTNWQTFWLVYHSRYSTATVKSCYHYTIAKSSQARATEWLQINFQNLCIVQGIWEAYSQDIHLLCTVSTHAGTMLLWSICFLAVGIHSAG